MTTILLSAIEYAGYISLGASIYRGAKRLWDHRLAKTRGKVYDPDWNPLKEALGQKIDGKSVQDVHALILSEAELIDNWRIKQSIFSPNRKYIHKYLPLEVHMEILFSDWGSDVTQIVVYVNNQKIIIFSDKQKELILHHLGWAEEAKEKKILKQEQEKQLRELNNSDSLRAVSWEKL